MSRLQLLGRSCFGVAVAASGLLQLFSGAFVRLAQPPLPWLGAGTAGPRVTGSLLLLAGVALAGGYRVRGAAVLSGAFLLGLFVLKGVPDILSNPSAGFMWTNPAKMLALAGGALLLAAVPEKWPWAASGLLAVFLLICGVQHFVYAGFVDTLVPAWLPPGPRFWTIFCAVALIAGGIGVLLPRTRGRAGFCAGLMIFLWVFLVHLPRAMTMKSPPELAGVFEALALAGVAWLVAGQNRGDRIQTPRR